MLSPSRNQTTKAATILTAAALLTGTLVASPQGKPNLKSGIVKDNFDANIRPQDDFYQYVHGSWLKKAEIPQDRTSTGTFIELRDQSQKDVRVIIEELAQDKSLKAGSDQQKVADLYKSFMDEKKREHLGLAPIKSYLDQAAAIKTKADLATYFAKASSWAISPIVFYVSSDSKKATEYRGHIWQAGLGLPNRDYYLEDTPRFKELRQAYEQFIQKMFRLAGWPAPAATAKKIMALETAIAKGHWDKVTNRDADKTYNKLTLAELEKLTPGFPMTAYIQALGYQPTANPHLIVNQPSHLTNLAQLITDANLTDWRLYAQWHILKSQAYLLGKAFANESFNFYGKTLNGQAEQEPLWKRGVELVNNNIGEVVAKVYVNRHFKPEAKARMATLVENLREAYRQSIDELAWMSPASKKAAHEKLALFRAKIGYPDRWHDYSSLVITGDDLVGNIYRINEFDRRDSFAKLQEPIRRWEWHMNPQTVNAYYSPSQNEIVFPAAILQPPFFDLHADDAVNYGGIGAVIGHEMGHGFDDQGSKYDGAGNLRNWWTDSDRQAFELRSKALIKQFDNFKVFADLNVNGALTVGENIGDLSGVTIAYKAYQLAQKKNGPAPVMDGLSGDQRFFIGYAQIWRSKTREAALRNRVATNPHAPSRFRVMGILPNVPEFYEAFNVAKKDAMYLDPKERVKIW